MSGVEALFRLTPCARHIAPVALLAGMLGGSLPEIAAHPAHFTAAPPATEEEAAAQYVSNLRRLLETGVVPDLKRGIVSVALSRPASLVVDVTDDPSPYAIGAKTNADGSLSARLSLGYLALHDAALDAVALSNVLDRRGDLRRYLAYQLQLAHDNYSRRSRGEPAQRAKTFAQFIGLDSKDAQAIFAEPEWRAARDAIETQSLLWVLAQLLARADPAIVGMTSPRAARNGAGAARLAAAAGAFPVPPLATALGMAQIERSPVTVFEERVVLCRAARLMAAGVTGLRASEPWRSKLSMDPQLQSRLERIQIQIAGMRRDGRCTAAGPLTAQAAWSGPKDVTSKRLDSFL